MKRFIKKMKRKKRNTRIKKQTWVNRKDWFLHYYRIIVPAAVCILAVIVLIGILIGSSSKKGKNNSDSKTGVDENGVATEVPIDLLQENAYEHVNQFMSVYFKALADGDVETFISMRTNTDDTDRIKMQIKSKYVESYNNLICYTKPGPTPNSFMVYAYNEIKFYDIETLVPGLNAFYVCTTEDNELIIFAGETDENSTFYMQEVSTQLDVIDLFTKVQVKYNDAVDSDEELSLFLEKIAPQIKGEVGEEVAKLNASEQPEEPEPTVEDPVVEEPVEVDVPPVIEKVRTKDVVNVRSSASETADKVGKAKLGDVYTRLEILENGWSKVEFEGKEAYIKTEFLEPVEASIGSIVILETVNIRLEANTTAERAGIAYADDVFELYETMDNGWSRINFNNKVAFVKSEFTKIKE